MERLECHVTWTQMRDVTTPVLLPPGAIEPMHWLLRLAVALSLVMIGCAGLLLHGALPVGPSPADLLFGFVAR